MSAGTSTMIESAPTESARVFALTPGAAKPDDFIDYTTKAGINLFHKATVPLPILFDGKSDTVNVFNEKFTYREKWQDGRQALVTL